MFRLTIGTILVATAFISSTAFADHETIKPKDFDSLGKCVKAALSKHDGKIVKVFGKITLDRNQNLNPDQQITLTTFDGIWQYQSTF